jgi:hypothetical protein
MPIVGFCGFLFGVFDGNMIRHAVAGVVPMAMFGAMCYVTAKAEDKTLNPYALLLSQVVIIAVGSPYWPQCGPRIRCPASADIQA